LIVAIDLPAMTDAEVRAIYRRISNWNRWGEADERGTLNYLTDAHRKRAAALVCEGVSIGCGRAVDTSPSPMNTIPAQHHMTAAGDVAPEMGAGVAYDHIGIFSHGQAQSHLDALCHISDSRRMYNGRPSSLVTSRGSSVGAITVASDGVLGRGVFLDIARARGVDYLDPDAPVRPEDLNGALAAAGTDIGEGDILIYRTGRHERRAILGEAWERLPDGRGHLPGLYPDCLEWIHERRIALIASDCAHDVLPAPFEQERIPIHVGTEVYMGLLLLHNLELDRLAQACRTYGRNEFMFVVAPLRIAGGTASPVNPIAIF